MTLHLAAPAVVPGISGGQILGAVTMSAMATVAWVILLINLMGTPRRLKLNSADKIGWGGFVTAALSLAAGGTWADITNGIGAVPTSVLGEDTGFGDPGAGGVALILGVLTFAPPWKRLLWPALLGIGLAAACTVAGGIGGIVVNVIRMVVFQVFRVQGA